MTKEQRSKVENLLTILGSGTMEIENVAKNLGLSKDQATRAYDSAMRKLCADRRVYEILEELYEHTHC